MFIVALGIFVSSQAPAALINFDGLNDPAPVGSPVPDGFEGLHWDNVYYLDGKDYQLTSGYQTGLVSPKNVAFNGWGLPATISGKSFNLVSAYLTSAWSNGNEVTVLGYDQGVVKYQEILVLDINTPKLINFNYLGIDCVKFYSDHDQFVMDNVEIAAVPEPSTYLAGLSTLGMLGWLAWKKR